MRHALAARLFSIGPRIGLLAVLGAVFVFSLGAAAWSAVVAGLLAQEGAGTAVLGALYAACEISRLPAAILLPGISLRFGARRVTQVGLLAIAVLPLIALTGLDAPKAMLILVLSALPSMAVYVGMPALVIGAARPGRDGWALAWMGLAGGAGGALGPWLGGTLMDAFGLVPPLVLFGLGSALLVPIATLGPLPDRTPWPGWTLLAGRGLPWQALAALALASAADAGRAALVPSELVHEGQPLGNAGLLLTIGASVAGVGFLAFGRLADRQPAMRVLGAGVLVLVAGSFASALATSWPAIFVVAASVLGMGASGTRLGAEMALIGWIGRDRADVAAALSEAAVLGGRVVGAPAAGTLGTTYGGSTAFGAIGLAAVASAAVFALVCLAGVRRLAADTLERAQREPELAMEPRPS